MRGIKIKNQGEESWSNGIKIITLGMVRILGRGLGRIPQWEYGFR